MLLEYAFGEKHNRLLSIKRLDLLRVHLFDMVGLGKCGADEHRQPNEQTNQVRDDARYDGIHGMISFSKANV